MKTLILATLLYVIAGTGILAEPTKPVLNKKIETSMEGVSIKVIKTREHLFGVYLFFKEKILPYLVVMDNDGRELSISEIGVFKTNYCQFEVHEAVVTKSFVRVYDGERGRRIGTIPLKPYIPISE